MAPGGQLESRSSHQKAGFKIHETHERKTSPKEKKILKMKTVNWPNEDFYLNKDN